MKVIALSALVGAASAGIAPLAYNGALLNGAPLAINGAPLAINGAAYGLPAGLAYSGPALAAPYAAATYAAAAPAIAAAPVAATYAAAPTIAAAPAVAATYAAAAPAIAAAPLVPAPVNYALPPVREVAEAPIVEQAVESVEQHGYSVRY